MSKESTTGQEQENRIEPVFTINRMGIVPIGEKHLTLADIGDGSSVETGVYAFIPVIDFREEDELVQNLWCNHFDRGILEMKDETGGLYYDSYYALSDLTVRPSDEGTLSLDFGDGQQPDIIPFKFDDTIKYNAFNIGDALAEETCKDGVKGYSVGSPIYGLGMLVPAETIFPDIETMGIAWIQAGERIGSKVQKDAINTSYFRNLEFDLQIWNELHELKPPEMIEQCARLFGDEFAADYNDAALEIDRKTGSVTITLKGEQLISRITINQSGDAGRLHKEIVVDFHFTEAVQDVPVSELVPFARLQYQHPTNVDYLQFLGLKHISHVLTRDGMPYYRELDFWNNLQVRHSSEDLAIIRHSENVDTRKSYIALNHKVEGKYGCFEYRLKKKITFNNKLRLDDAGKIIV